MSDRPGICPVCNQPFKDGDDVVTCPQCGTPYHRTCYQQVGVCVHSDKHASGFEYAPPRQDPQPPPAQQGNAPPASGGWTGSHGNSGGILCKNCNTVNDATNIFCEKCGHPLRATENTGWNNNAYGGYQQPFPGQQVPPTGQPGPGGPGYGPGGAPGYGPVYGGADLAGEIDGIPKRDWAEFIGNAAPTYLYRLTQMVQRGRNLSFMVSAFFIPSYYYAYRKMWGWAALALLADLVSYFFNVIQQVGEAGVMVFPALSADALYTIYSVVTYLVLALRAVSGIFALYLYRRNAGKKITALREAYGASPGYHEELRRKGGVSVPGVVACVGIFMAFNYAIVTFIGADAVKTLYDYANSLMAGSLL